MADYSNKVTKPLDTSSLDAAIEDMKRIAAGEEPAAVKSLRPAPLPRRFFDAFRGFRGSG